MPFTFWDAVIRRWHSRNTSSALRLFLLPAIHLRQGCGEPPAGAMQEGHRHPQFTIQGRRGGSGGRRLPLRFQKQFRLGQDALADHARAVPPSGIELSGLPRVAMVLHDVSRAVATSTANLFRSREETRPIRKLMAPPNRGHRFRRFQHRAR